MECAAVEAIYPRLDDLLARMNVDAYVMAPFTSDQKWDKYLGPLQTFGLPLEKAGASASHLNSALLPSRAIRPKPATSALYLKESCVRA
ncbi:hypothetical protein DFH08DRAFT_128677 [Mycena albidolilacea]|uniref:Uncharacterized protein n=1 Tax=Mycena albidolilacea TaxID=1033008 RepID=A0AAD6YWS0_9AGAR|nr:hypothetical protein DFH08DRAFT_128677 [Mycena albidolilacea]